MHQVRVYTRHNCPHCAKAKLVLDAANVKYETLIIDEDIPRDTVLEMFPDAKQLPIITRDDMRVLLEDLI